MAESLIVRVAISGESLIVEMLIVSRGEFACQRVESGGERWRAGEQCGESKRTVQICGTLAGQAKVSRCKIYFYIKRLFAAYIVRVFVIWPDHTLSAHHHLRPFTRRKSEFVRTHLTEKRRTRQEKLSLSSLMFVKTNTRPSLGPAARRCGRLWPGKCSRHAGTRSGVPRYGDRASLKF